MLRPPGRALSVAAQALAGAVCSPCPSQICISSEGALCASLVHLQSALQAQDNVHVPASQQARRFHASSTSSGRGGSSEHRRNSNNSSSGGGRHAERRGWQGGQREGREVAQLPRLSAAQIAGSFYAACTPQELQEVITQHKTRLTPGCVAAACSRLCFLRLPSEDEAPLLQQLLCILQPRLPEALPSETLKVVHALGQLQFDPPGGLQQYVDAFVARLRWASTRDAVNMLAALPSWGRLPSTTRPAGNAGSAGASSSGDGGAPAAHAAQLPTASSSASGASLAAAKRAQRELLVAMSDIEAILQHALEGLSISGDLGLARRTLHALASMGYAASPQQVGMLLEAALAADTASSHSGDQQQQQPQQQPQQRHALRSTAAALPPPPSPQEQARMLVGVIGSAQLLAKDSGWLDGQAQCLPMAPVVAAFAERGSAVADAVTLTSFLYHLSWLMPPHVTAGWLPEGRRVVVHVMQAVASSGIIAGMTPSTAVNCLRSAANMQLAEPSFITAAQQAITQQLHKLDARLLAAAARAAARLSQPGCEQLISAAAAAGVAKLAGGPLCAGDAGFDHAALIGLLWAPALVRLPPSEQLLEHLGVLAGALAAHWEAPLAGRRLNETGMVQLLQVRLWLEEAGVAQALTLFPPELWAQCEQAWRESVSRSRSASLAEGSHRAALRERVLQVAEALAQAEQPQQNGQQPQAEQAPAHEAPGSSVSSERWQLQVEGREVLAEPDQLFSVDIAARLGPHHLAIEVDGPSHFLHHPLGQPTGPTRFRRAALTHRGYVVVSIPYYEWEGMRRVATPGLLLARVYEQVGAQAAACLTAGQ